MGQEAQVTLQSGHKLMKVGDYSGALKIYNRIIGDQPRNAEAHYHAGNALIGMGQKNAETAITAYQNAITRNQYYASAYFKKGLELSFSFGRNEEALSNVAKAISIGTGLQEPLLVQCSIVLSGFVLSRLGRDEEADFSLALFKKSSESPFKEKLRKEFVYTEDEHLSEVQEENLIKLLRMYDYLE